MSEIIRDTVFVAGGQPTITYVDRHKEGIERELARAIAAPNFIVSLAGPSKCGKTVLCRHVLGNQQYIWTNGGEVSSSKELWDKVRDELNFPIEETTGDASERGVSGGLKGFIFSIRGSQLLKSERKRTFRIDSMAAATKHMIEEKIALIVDDFHYLSEEVRLGFVRSVRAAVFAGLKVVLIAVPHRIFEALKAEPDIKGRFQSAMVPEWTKDELSIIPAKGFEALNVKCPKATVAELVNECQLNPLLMQKFCWEICYDMKIDKPTTTWRRVTARINLHDMFVRLSKDAGRPIYDALRGGPQIRKDRQKRPLAEGGEADVYEAVLLAMAETGPKATIPYGEMRSTLDKVLSAHAPQANEVTSVLKQMSRISRERGGDGGVDWDENSRTVSIDDPYLRFYLRWQIRQQN